MGGWKSSGKTNYFWESLLGIIEDIGQLRTNGNCRVALANPSNSQILPNNYHYKISPQYPLICTIIVHSYDCQIQPAFSTNVKKITKQFYTEFLHTVATLKGYICLEKENGLLVRYGSVHAIIGLFQPILTVFHFINDFTKMKKNPHFLNFIEAKTYSFQSWPLEAIQPDPPWIITTVHIFWYHRSAHFPHKTNAKYFIKIFQATMLVSDLEGNIKAVGNSS